VSVVFGGLVFGIGMQLAGSCTSGSLGNAGRGHWNGWLALVMMIAGATLAAYHFDWWQAQASWLPFSWVDHLGWKEGLLTTLLLLALAYGLLLYMEYRVRILGVVSDWINQYALSPATANRQYTVFTSVEDLKKIE
jgi:uncharacterized membrane protein YedE/YeeE